MLIKKISLSNFRNFKKSEIEFSTDSEKKITIILGQNTFGKTTLVKAFIWCLYRENLFDDKKLINMDIVMEAKEGDEMTVQVEVVFEHNNFEYCITTKETYIKSDEDGIILKPAYSNILKKELSDSSYSSLSDESKIEAEINSILGKDLYEYFFYDGETNQIDSINSKKNLGKAISNIMGIEKIENLKKFYNKRSKDSVYSYLQKELKLEEGSNLRDLKGELEEKKDEYYAIEKEIIETEQEFNETESIINKKQQELDANKDVENDQIEKRAIDKEINIDRQNREKLFSELINSVNGAYSSTPCFLAKILFAKAYRTFNINKIRESSDFNSSSQLYEGITAEAVRSLITSQKCICGSQIIEGDALYNHLLDAIQYMEPNNFSGYINRFCESQKCDFNDVSPLIKTIKDNARQLSECISSIENNKNKLDNIEKRITGRKDVGIIQQEISSNNQRLGYLRSTIENRKESLKKKDDEIAILELQYKRAAIKDENNEIVKKALEYVEHIYNLVDEEIDKAKEGIRGGLEKEVGLIFKSMYKGNRDIQIDDNFIAYAIDSESSKKLDLSTGLKTIISYSYVAGLMKLLKTHILKDLSCNDKEDFSHNECYPLVMDAPFSNVDDEHIKNICSALPKYCDQIIIFIMSKDFEYAKKSIYAHIGKKYKLDRKSERLTIVEEESI